MSLRHIFEQKVVFSNERRNISSTQQLNFTISTGSDNSFYSLYDSYLTLDCVAVTGVADAATYIRTRGQPAGLVANSKAIYTYIDPSGELVTMEINGDNENIGYSRGVIDSLFTAKRIHDLDGGYLEFPYRTTLVEDTLGDDKPQIFNNVIKTTLGNDNKDHYFTLKIPYRQFLEGANTMSFINLKQLEVSMKLHNWNDFFGQLVAAENTAEPAQNNISNIYITKCVLHNSVWSGDESEISPELRELTNVTISTKSFDISDNATNFDNNVIVNFPVKYLIMYLTDTEDTHSSLLEFVPSYLSVGVSGGGKTAITNFESDKLINVSMGGQSFDMPVPDDTLFDITSYCVNTGREESLLNYDSWQKRMKYIVYPLSEMLSQKASNIFEINIKWSTTPGACKLNCIFIKDSSAN